MMSHSFSHPEILLEILGILVFIVCQVSSLVLLLLIQELRGDIGTWLRANFSVIQFLSPTTSLYGDTQGLLHSSIFQFKKSTPTLSLFYLIPLWHWLSLGDGRSTVGKRFTQISSFDCVLSLEILSSCLPDAKHDHMSTFWENPSSYIGQRFSAFEMIITSNPYRIERTFSLIKVMALHMPFFVSTA